MTFKIDNNDQGKITILSGEGECGNRELYKGKHTIRALKLRMAKERSNGDRWARAEYHKDGYKGDDGPGVWNPEILNI